MGVVYSLCAAAMVLLLGRRRELATAATVLGTLAPGTRATTRMLGTLVVRRARLPLLALAPSPRLALTPSLRLALWRRFLALRLALTPSPRLAPSLAPSLTPSPRLALTPSPRLA